MGPHIMASSTLVGLAFLTMIVAAARSTWSPCSLSMLSMVTPVGEASRGHRYPVTAAWFVGGAVLGGACFGGLMAGFAALIHGLSLTGRTLAVTALTAAIVAVAADLGPGGFALPRIPRQVNESWLNEYRGWTYGAAYGWQIGVGLTTYVMSAAVYLMIVLGSLTGRPVIGFTVGLGFGTCRGLALLLGARLTTPASIRSMHRWFEAAAPVSLRLAVAGEIGVTVVAAVSAGWLAAAVTALSTVVAIGLLDAVGVRDRRDLVGVR
jgi:hypothetical protein